MHFEVLVEDQSGKIMLNILMPKIIGQQDTFRVIAYKGLGKIPPDFCAGTDASKRILLNQLPKLINGYGRSLSPSIGTVVVVCDLDSRNQEGFLAELKAVYDQCSYKPRTLFCLAIEEGEAWLLGDISAIKRAFPNAKDSVLRSYQNDSICGTWELLADAIYRGGAEKLKKEGFQGIGREKCLWALKISPEMNIQQNQSPSFRSFVNDLQKLAKDD